MADERREIIEKAWEEAEKAENKPEDKNEDGKELPVAGEVTPEKDLEKEPVGKQEEKPDAYAQEKKVAQQREEPGAAPVQQAAPVTDRAPVSWKPAQREQWAKLPADVRSEISRREREIQEGFKQTETVRKFANEFAQIVHPYQHLIAQQGSTPLRAVENLMRTAAGLSTGSQEQKARIVAEIIGNYGIDLRALDSYLSTIVKDGKIQPSAPQQERPPAWAAPMFEFMNTVQQSRVQAETRARESAAVEVEKISEKPFFEDVREDMADLMEVAARRGRPMTLEQAYDQAVKMNPEISGILSQREAAARSRSPVSEAAATLARARKAASTVSGGPSGEGSGIGKIAPKSRREAIEDAWEQASSR